MIICKDQGGFIKLERVFQDSVLMANGNEDLLKIWISFLFWAHWKDGADAQLNGIQHKLKRGQFMATQREIAAKLGWSRAKVERALSRFKTEQRIEQLTDHRSSIITIVNYSEYQDNRTTAEPQTEQLNVELPNNCRTTAEQLKGCSLIEEENKKERTLSPGARENWNAQLQAAPKEEPVPSPERLKLAQDWFEAFRDNCDWVMPYNVTPEDFTRDLARIETEVGLDCQRIREVWEYAKQDKFWAEKITKPEDFLKVGMGKKDRFIDQILRKVTIKPEAEKTHIKEFEFNAKDRKTRAIRT